MENLPTYKKDTILSDDEIKELRGKIRSDDIEQITMGNNDFNLITDDVFNILYKNAIIICEVVLSSKKEFIYTMFRVERI